MKTLYVIRTQGGVRGAGIGVIWLGRLLEWQLVFLLNNYSLINFLCKAKFNILSYLLFTFKLLTINNPLLLSVLGTLSNSNSLI